MLGTGTRERSGGRPRRLPHFRAGDRIIRTISLVARFDTAVEVTLDELRIELTYPQDTAAEEFFRELARAHAPAALDGFGA